MGCYQLTEKSKTKPQAKKTDGQRERHCEAGSSRQTDTERGTVRQTDTERGTVRQAAAVRHREAL